MDTVLRAWGNSQGIYIPKEFTREMGISINDKLTMTVENGRIVISKDNSGSVKEKALNSLNELRTINCSSSDTINNHYCDYRTIYEEYLDERYAK